MENLAQEFAVQAVVSRAMVTVTMATTTADVSMMAETVVERVQVVSNIAPAVLVKIQRRMVASAVLRTTVLQEAPSRVMATVMMLTITADASTMAVIVVARVANPISLCTVLLANVRIQNTRNQSSR